MQLADVSLSIIVSVASANAPCNAGGAARRGATRHLMISRLAFVCRLFSCMSIATFNEHRCPSRCLLDDVIMTFEIIAWAIEVGRCRICIIVKARTQSLFYILGVVRDPPWREWFSDDVSSSWCKESCATSSEFSNLKFFYQEQDCFWHLWNSSNLMLHAIIV